MGISNKALDVLKFIEKNKLKIFSAKDIILARKLSAKTVYRILETLKHNGLIDELKKGTYFVPKMFNNEFELYTAYFAPAYVSLWSALSFYDLTEQVPLKVDIVTTRYIRPIKNVNLHIIDKRLFLGYVNVGFPIASKEKTIFDLLWFHSISLKQLKKIVVEEKISVNKVLFFLKFVNSEKRKKELENKIRWLFDR